MNVNQVVIVDNVLALEKTIRSVTFNNYLMRVLVKICFKYNSIIPSLIQR